MKRRMSTVVATLGATVLISSAPGQTYEVTWYTVDGGGVMNASGGVYEVSGTIGQPDAGELSGATYAVKGGFWVPLPCFPAAPPVLEVLNKEFTTPVNRKNRYISVSLTDANRQQAIRVVLGPKPGRGGSIPPPFEIWKGEEFYAGEPRQYCENAGMGETADPTTPCGPAPGVYANGQYWFWGAPLVCEKGTAHYMDWTTLANYCNTPGNAAFDGQPCPNGDADCGGGICGVSPVVHLFHEGIVPSHMAAGAGPVDYDAVYEVSAIDSSCPLNVATSYSPPVQILQAPWGDVNTDVTQVPNGPPNESVGVGTDVVGLLNKFSNLPGAMQKARCDLLPCRVDFVVGISDVVACLSAFSGGDYEDTCGSGQCGPLGLCKGTGDDHGTPCTNDDDCNSDVCFGKLEVAATRPGSLGLGSKPRRRAVNGDRTRPAGPAITAVPSRTVIQPGDTIDVDVYVANVADLRAYEVKLNVQGGGNGQVSLLDLGADKIRPDYVFSGREEVGAVDRSNRRMCGALVSGAADAAEHGYLGTYTFQVSADASAAFEISIQVDEDASLLLNPLSAPIAFTPGSAVVTVSADPVGTIAGGAE